MPSSNPNFILSDPATGVERANALHQYGGTVLVEFRRTTLFYDMRQTFINIKTAGSGFEDFPILASDPPAEHHIPGDRLLGQTQKFDKVVIDIDDLIVGDRFIAGDDMTIAHFSAVEPYAKAIGRQLAYSADDKIARMLVLAARAPANPGFHSGGNTVVRIGAGTTIADCYPLSVTGATNFRSDLRQMGLQLDQREAPVEGRAAVLTPYGRAVLQFDNTIFSRDYQDGVNDAMSRRIGKVEGFDLYVSNRSIPNELMYEPRGPRYNPAKYDVNTLYANADNTTGQPIALIFTGSSEGSAPLGMKVAEEFYTFMEYQPDRSGTFMMGRQFLGVNKLAVWCAGEVRGAKTQY